MAADSYSPVGKFYGLLHSLSSNCDYLSKNQASELFDACERAYPLVHPELSECPILIINTGGTFACRKRQDGLLEPMPRGLLIGELQNRVPFFKDHPLGNLDAATDQHEFVLMELHDLIDSTMMKLVDWNILATVVYTHLSSRLYYGVVIIHGTDTLAYTASALSFMTRRLPYPIVITGSQHPLLADDTDAVSNITCACRAITDLPPENVRMAGVFVAFNQQLFLGSRVRKVHSTDNDAFASPNLPVLARFLPGSDQHWQVSRFLPVIACISESLAEEIEMRTFSVYESGAEEMETCAGCFDHPRLHLVHPRTRIKVITLAPGWENELLVKNHSGSRTTWGDCTPNEQSDFARRCFESYSAVVVQCYGSGGVPTPYLELLTLAQKWIPVCYILQPIRGGNNDVYGTSVGEQHGGVRLNDMTLEATIAKLSVMISQSRYPKNCAQEVSCRDVKWLYEAMSAGLAGEIRDSHWTWETLDSLPQPLIAIRKPVDKDFICDFVERFPMFDHEEEASQLDLARELGLEEIL